MKANTDHQSCKREKRPSVRLYAFMGNDLIFAGFVWLCIWATYWAMQLWEVHRNNKIQYATQGKVYS